MPPPTVEWYRSGKLITRSPKAEPTYDEHSAQLTVRRAADDDAGDYTIRVRNACGEAEATLTLLIIRKPSAPSAPEPLEVTADSLTLFWRAPEDDGNAPITEYILEYQETTQTTWTQITHITDTTHRVTKLRTNSSYRFRAVACNEVGTSPPSPTSSAILVAAPLTKEPPTIQEPLVDQTVGLQQRCTLQCIVGGSPAPQITWYKNGIEIAAQTSGTHIEYESRVARCTIATTTATTEAVYRCEARNECGQTATECRVSVQEKPSIAVDEQLLQQRLRTAATWQVSGDVTGYPRPEVCWYRNGVRIADKSTRTLTISESSIEITALERSDSGKYTIEARNAAGVVSVELQLTVIDKPTAPEQVAVAEVKKDAVVLEWKPPRDDGGLEITAYSIEKCDPEQKVWIKVAEVERHIDSYCVQKLLANAQYIFRVMAQNPVGVSDAVESDAVTIKVRIEVPSAPRRPTEVSGMTDTTLTLAWLVPERDGGSAIVEYVVEVRESGREEWTRYGTTEVTHIFVERLTKGASYEFRICARNDAGVGQALITEDMIVAGRKISKCDKGFNFHTICLSLYCPLCSITLSLKDREQMVSCASQSFFVRFRTTALSSFLNT